ncbi:hypothetical protein ACO0RG_000095 [Hanseniaspora osmophila]
MADQYEARVSNNMGQNLFEDDVDDADFFFSNETSVSPNRSTNFNSIFNNDFLVNDDDEDDDDDDDDMLELYNLTPRQRLYYKLKHTLWTKNVKKFKKLAQWQKIILIVLMFLFVLFVLTFAVMHKKILEYLVETSNELYTKWYTSWVLFALIYVVAFPPMIGYSLLSTSVGMIYGVSFKGWFLLASGTILGSVSSFYVFQKFLNNKAEKLVHSNRKFEAIASVLQENNSYILLALVRLCPFPYSLTNGALAGIYGIKLKNFIIANCIVSPKLILYLFIGSRFKNLGEENNPNKVFDLLSIVFALAVLSVTAGVLYSKTKKRYRELQSDIL